MRVTSTPFLGEFQGFGAIGVDLLNSHAQKASCSGHHHASVDAEGCPMPKPASCMRPMPSGNFIAHGLLLRHSLTTTKINHAARNIQIQHVLRR